jgi:hypothetical protein
LRGRAYIVADEDVVGAGGDADAGRRVVAEDGVVAAGNVEACLEAERLSIVA